MAHREVPVRVKAWVDEGIAPLVQALDHYDDVLTLASCQDDQRHGGAYVFFRVRATATAFASRLAATLNAEPKSEYLLQVEWRPGEDEPMLALSCPPNQVPLLADLISSDRKRP